MEHELLYEAMSLKQFEPQSALDWFRIPFYLSRWFVFWWVAVITVNLQCLRLRLFNVSFIITRATDCTPVICPRCLWAGPMRWLYHGYHGTWDGDVEPYSECPRCGNEI